MLQRHLPPIAIALILILPTIASANQNNSLMDVSPDGKRLLATNNDNYTVTVVDTVANKALREIKVGKKPECVTWIGNGPLAAVTCYVDDSVVIFDTQSGKVVKTLPVDDEPYGIVSDRAGKFAWVTHEYPGTVSEIDLEKQAVSRKLKVAPWLRGIALSPDEKRLYVAEFYTAKLHAIDRASGKVVDSWKGHSTDNLCRHVLLHPRRPKAYLAHVRSMVKVISGSGSIFPHTTIFDLRPDKGQKRRTSIAMDSYNDVYVVTNAWESDMTPDGKLIYTLYAGTNDMNVSRVIDDDYREMERLFLPRTIGTNPRAVRVSPDGEKVYVYNAMDFNVTVHDPKSLRRLATIKVCDPPKSPEWVLGKVLFNSARFPMTRRRWVACASCHPDGNHDGRVWHNPEGLRKTTAFFGMAHTHPLHWSGDRDETQDFEYTIRSPLMVGGGLFRGRILPKRGYEKIELKQKLSGVSKELDALAIYCNSFDFTLSPHAEAPGKLSEAAERGKKIFFSKEVGCASCHNGPYYTDSRLKTPFNLYDVGTGKEDKNEKMGMLYDTPTLLGVYRQRLYLHHGQAKTLREVLTKFNPNDKHGKTSHLSAKQLDDLIAFLKSLPFEHPPAMTDNTVEHRFVAPEAKKE